jgi:hypothetical protein
MLSDQAVRDQLVQKLDWSQPDYFALYVRDADSGVLFELVPESFEVAMSNPKTLKSVRIVRADKSLAEQSITAQSNLVFGMLYFLPLPDTTPQETIDLVYEEVTLISAVFVLLLTRSVVIMLLVDAVTHHQRQCSAERACGASSGRAAATRVVRRTQSRAPPLAFPYVRVESPGDQRR